MAIPPYLGLACGMRRGRDPGGLWRYAHACRHNGATTFTRRSPT